MKKIILLILIFFTTFLIFGVTNGAQNTARAESYAIVKDDNCPLYWDQTLSTIKFYLPKSYFVKILTFGVEYSRVSYLDDSGTYPETSGYVKNEYLDFSLTPDDVIYPNITLTLKNDDVLFLDAEKTQPKSVIKSKSTAIFYGEYFSGDDEYVYCYTQGLIGYIRKSSFENYTLPINNKIDELYKQDSALVESTDSELPNSNEKANSFNSSYIILGCAIVATLVIIYFIIRPERQQKNASFFTQDEF